MSQESLERVRAGYESFNRTHQADPEWMHPDIEWHTRADLPDSATHRGHEGVARLFSSWTEAFEGLRVDLLELIDAGEQVVAVVSLHGRVRGSEQEVDMTEAHVWRERDGKAIEVRDYNTKAEALEAVGLAA